jgi:hypothetical protein
MATELTGSASYLAGRELNPLKRQGYRPAKLSASNKVAATIKVGSYPWAIAITPF